MGITTYRCESIEDTYYGSTYAPGPNGSATGLAIGGWSDFYYAFLKFDLTGSPSIDVQSAVLWFYNSGGVNNSQSSFYRVTSTWDEDTLTRTVNPTWTSPGVTLPTTVGAGWKSVNILTLYNQWKAGTYTNYGITIRPAYNTNSVTYIDSKENPSGNAPYILVTSMVPMNIEFAGDDIGVSDSVSFISQGSRTYHVDYENGSDSFVSTPYGWWWTAFTNASGTPPVAGTRVVGHTSGAEAYLTTPPTITSGSFSGGDARGELYYYGKNGIFQNEMITADTGGTLYVPADAIYVAWKTPTNVPYGDHTVKFAKSPAPVSAGTTALWTNGSSTVTLTNAQNATVDRCETTWTGVTGIVTAVASAPTAGGTGYAVGNVLTITTGGTGATVLVTATSSGVVTAVSLETSGKGYTTGAGKVTSGGSGNGCTVNISTVGTTTCAIDTGYKREGTNQAALTINNSSIKKGTKLGYHAISPGDLTSYHALSFWIMAKTTTGWSQAVTAGQYKFALCSDTTGDVIVDEFPIPSIIAVASQMEQLKLTISKRGGGTLGASAIQSIAIYTDTLSAGGSTSMLLFDDIIASKTNGLSLTSLISKNTLEQSTTSATGYGNEPWYPIESIVGTTVILKTTATLYAGATETVPLYIRDTFKVSTANGGINITVDGGTYLGGYDTATNLATGVSIYDGQALSASDGLTFSSNRSTPTYDVTVSGFSFVQFTNGISIETGEHDITIGTIYDLTSNTIGLLMDGSTNGAIDRCEIGSIINCTRNGSYGIKTINLNNSTIGTINNISEGTLFSLNGSNNIIDTVKTRGGTSPLTFNYDTVTFFRTTNNIVNNFTTTSTVGASFVAAEGNIIKNLTIPSITAALPPASNSLSGGAGWNYVNNLNTSGTLTNSSAVVTGSDPKIFYNNYGGYSYILGTGVTVKEQNATAGGTGKEWLITTHVVVPTTSPFYMSLSKVLVTAGTLVTVTTYFKKSNSTSIMASLLCRGGQIDGVPVDVISAAPSDTNRNNVTITFTPSVTGVVEIEAMITAISGSMTVIIDDMTINQA